MKTLILDNYDSFTFNLYQYVGELGGNPEVFRNDEISVEDVSILRQAPPSASLRKGTQNDTSLSHIILSPGPGNPETPRDIGISYELIDYALKNKIPLLGVCLGHQTIAHRFGATVSRASEIFHGRESKIKLLKPRSVIFKNIPPELVAMRYHSLIVEEDTLPKNIRVTAKTIANDLVMAIEHTEYPIYGIQFHPESIGTLEGKAILKNFLSL